MKRREFMKLSAAAGVAVASGSVIGKELQRSVAKPTDPIPEIVAERVSEDMLIDLEQVSNYVEVTSRSRDAMVHFGNAFEGGGIRADLIQQAPITVPLTRELHVDIETFDGPLQNFLFDICRKHQVLRVKHGTLQLDERAMLQEASIQHNGCSTVVGLDMLLLGDGNV